MSIKLQLTAPLLEKMIEEDPTLEVEIRKAVIENFAHRNLKSIINTEAAREVIEMARKSALDLVRKEVGQLVKSSYGRSSFVLSERYKEDMKEEMVKLIREFVDEEVAPVTIVEKRIEEIRKRVLSNVERVSDYILNTQFQNRVEEEVDKRLASALALSTQQQLSIQTDQDD